MVFALRLGERGEEAGRDMLVGYSDINGSWGFGHTG